MLFTFSKHPQKRRKLSRYIPDDKYALGTHDSQIVELKDIQYEYTILSARIDLVRRDTALLTSGGSLHNAICLLVSLLF
jgi:hypothetical protein